jgi:cyclase
MASMRLDLPTLLVADSLTLVRGNREIEIRYLGIGNTRGDLVVHLPKEGIAVTGDLAILPMQFALGSYIRPWIDTLDRVAELGAETWVPGHGPVQHDASYLGTVRDVLRTIDREVADGMAGGLSLEELKATLDVPEYRKRAGAEDGLRREWFDTYFLAPAIERSFAGRSGEPE